MKFRTTEPAITGPRALRDPRSREYAIQTMRSLKRFLESKSFDAQHVEKELGLIIEHKHWEVCGFKNLDAYLQAEVGTGLKQLRSRLAQDLAADPTVAAARPANSGRPKREGKVANSYLAKGSTSAARIVAKLKRDAPEIAKALARGEFKSARAAAIAAGMIKVKTPLDQLRHWWKKANSRERTAFIAEIERLI
jgi:hypothetical protein